MPREPSRRKRFAVLQCGHSKEGARAKYGDYSDMCKKLLASPKEDWLIFSVVDGQFPTIEELEMLDGVVVTGSKHDAHAEEEWIEKLCILLRNTHRHQKRILGICFGHQVLARALGGASGRSPCGWEVGIRQLQLHPSIREFPQAAVLPPHPRIIETHRDQVLKLPPGGVVLASSSATAVEMFAVGPTSLGIQGHPEFEKDVLEELVQSRLEDGILPPSVGEAALKGLHSMDPDKLALQQFCRLFLKEEAPASAGADAGSPMALKSGGLCLGEAACGRPRPMQQSQEFVVSS